MLLPVNNGILKGYDHRPSKTQNQLHTFTETSHASADRLISVFFAGRRFRFRVRIRLLRVPSNLRFFFFVIFYILTITNKHFRGKAIQDTVNIPIWVAFTNPLITVELCIENSIFTFCILLFVTQKSLEFPIFVRYISVQCTSAKLLVWRWVDLCEEYKKFTSCHEGVEHKFHFEIKLMILIPM